MMLKQCVKDPPLTKLKPDTKLRIPIILLHWILYKSSAFLKKRGKEKQEKGLEGVEQCEKVLKCAQTHS